MDGDKDIIGERPRKSMLRRLMKALVIVSFSFLLLIVAFTLSIPYLITHVSIPTLEFDLAPYIKGKAAELVKSKKASADITIKRTEPKGYKISARGKLLDWSYSATAFVNVGFIKADGSVSLSLDDTDWKLFADFNAASKTDWRFNAEVKERRISEDDAVLASVLDGLKLSAVSNLSFSGSFSLNAEGECTEKRPVPSWKVQGRLKDVDANFNTAAGKNVNVKQLRLSFGAEGIADHTDIAPLFPKAESITVAGIFLTNVFVSVRATERAYLVTEAGAQCCGGDLRLYSLFLDPQKLSAGATIFVEGIDAGAVLSYVSAFHGQASGRLYGKLPFFLKNGKELHISNAYLFSKPGETGVVRVSDARPIMNNLALGGVSADVQSNLSKALANLDYDILKIELTRGEDGEDSALAVKLEGSATHGETTVPVKLDVTFHGDIDQLVNTGIDLSRRRR